MSRSSIFMKSAIGFFEARNKSFHLKKPIIGWGFTKNEKKNIPAGDYVVVEPDDRDSNRMIISKKKSFEMYSIHKSDIPKG